MEHLFDVKQVLSNYMNLVKIGGSLFICTNANNLCGHGFYQFSPEFFYRVFTEANGFAVESLCLIETPLHLRREERAAAGVLGRRSGQRRQARGDRHRQAGLDLGPRAAHRRPAAVRPGALPERLLHAVERCRLRRRAGHRDPGARTAPTAERFTYVSGWEAVRRSLRQRRKNSLRNRKLFKPVAP